MKKQTPSFHFYDEVQALCKNVKGRNGVSEIHPRANVYHTVCLIE